MGEVLKFTGNTVVDGTAEDALEKAKGWGLKSCCIAGLTENGEFVFGGSTSDIGLILLILELAKDEIIEVAKES